MTMKIRWACMAWGAVGVVALGAVLSLGSLALQGIQRTGYYEAWSDCTRLAATAEQEAMCAQLRSEHNRRFWR